MTYGPPGAAAVVSRARALVTRQLARWGLDDLAESTEPIVSELVTNAVVHGGGGCDNDRTIGLRLIRHAVLTCEVSDSSHSHPLLHRPTATDEHGRGLFLVAQLSRAWGPATFRKASSSGSTSNCRRGRVLRRDQGRDVIRVRFIHKC
ncbi:ATP-binding protein [Streptomyces sp. NPDC006207]|nr:ATP-binding protein [Streptomyces sp. PA03-5A]